MPRRGPQGRSEITRRIGARVREVREAQGITQAELARRAHTSRSVVHGVEEGSRTPTLLSLHGMARALGVPLARFFSKDEGPTTSPAIVPAFARLMTKLRDADPEYLRAVEEFLRWYDRHGPRATRRR